MTLRQYDPKSVLATLGAIPLTGFADGSFIKIESNSDAFTLQMGVDGEGTRTRSNDNSAKITITLMQSSESNALLSALHSLDKAAPGGIGCVPFLCKDLLGTSVYAAQKAWITKRPAADFAGTAGPREWVIETDELLPFDGGN